MAKEYLVDEVKPHFGRLRIDIKKERLDANLKEEELKKTTEEVK